jgi:molybdate-binding protein/DNA-binding transcriptional regulator YhcF (GntR family)
MESSSFLYQKIVESIRQDIFSGTLKPGSRLPAIRSMTNHWQCNTGTILRAYQELARLGLVVSNAGKGTQVVDRLPEQSLTPMRRALLINRTEAFLLEILTSGYTPDEVEQSLQAALGRWRNMSDSPAQDTLKTLRFIGSHDPAMALIAAHYHEVTRGITLQLSFTGSLGGLKALAENKADLAGCHLWDENTDTYNETYIRKLLPGRKFALLTLAYRRVGLILPPGNPHAINNLGDLLREDSIFVNRQPDSGTRVWLDAQLHRAGIDPARIKGFQNEKTTHSEVARAVSIGLANVGIGVETAALLFGLDFKLLTTERYDLVIPSEKWELPSIQALKNWLQTTQAKSAINNLGGYDTTDTGVVNWVS